jgi:hypothetical protein
VRVHSASPAQYQSVLSAASFSRHKGGHSLELKDL